MPPSDSPATNADAQHDLQAARRHVAAGRFAEAEQAYGRALALCPEDAESLHFLGAAAEQRGDFDVAVNLLSRASKAAPTNFNVLTELGIVYRRAERYDAARYTLERATRLGAARNPSVRLVLAHLLETDLRQDLALLHYCQAMIEARQLRRWQGDDGIGYEVERLVPHATQFIATGRRAWFDRALASAREGADANRRDRIDDAVAQYLGEHQFALVDPRQRAGFMHVPGLRAAAFHDPAAFAWLTQVADLAALSHEADACLATAPVAAGAFQLPLYARGLVQYEARRHAPRLRALVEALPLAWITNFAPDVALVAIDRDARLPLQYGASNARCQIIVNLDDSTTVEVVVGGESRTLARGACIALDPSLGVAYRNTGATRAKFFVLDAWHPDLSDGERRALSAVVVAALDFDARLQEVSA